MQKVIITLVAALPPVGAVIMLTGFIFLIFGILGLGLFRGMYMYCEDQYSGDISGKEDCRGIFQFDSYGWTDSGYSLDGAWGVYRPRVWLNPRWNFDNIFKSLESLFIISTLDNWSEILDSGMDITGKDSQPTWNHAWYSAFFFVIFVLIGAILMTQIFVAVIMINFQRARGDVLSRDQEIHRDCGLMVQAMWGGRTPRPPEPDSKLRKAFYNVCTDCLPHHHDCQRPYHLVHRHFDDVVMLCKSESDTAHSQLTPFCTLLRKWNSNNDD